jgi:uncharacterized membrane protein YobD (UPF0266 family)
MPNYIQTFILGICLKELIKTKKSIWTYVLIILCCINNFLWHGLGTTLFLILSALFIVYVTIFNEKTILNKENKFTVFLQKTVFVQIK